MCGRSLILSLLLLITCSPQCVRAQLLDLTLNLPGHGIVELHLAGREAFAESSSVQAVTAGGIVQVDPSSIRVFRGTLPNQVKSFVVITQSRSGLIGSISVGTDCYDVQRGPLASSPLSVSRSDVKSRSCVMKEEQLPDAVRQVMLTLNEEEPQDSRTLELQVAVEADRELFFRSNSDRERALAYIAQVIAVTSAIYERDFNTRVVPSNVRLIEVMDDTYPLEADKFQLLDHFIEHYESTMTTLERDVAVFMTMREGSGGVAQSIGGICEAGRSYCVVDLAHDLDQVPNGYSLDQILLAHEIGHVCGALHTHNCFWPGGPLDSCFATENGTCVTEEQVRPTVGTIMSYCMFMDSGEGSMVAEFHPEHKKFVRAFLEHAKCVGARPISEHNKLHGRLFNTATGVGLGGVVLSIHVEVNGYFIAPPALGADTLSTTSPEGLFEFNGLSDGIYVITLPADLAIANVNYSYAAHEIRLLITDSIVERDIGVSQVRPITMKVLSNTDPRAIDFVLVSESLEGLTQVMMVPAADATPGAPFERYLPVGRYTVVPHSPRLQFIPVRQEFEVASAGPRASMVFTAQVLYPNSTAPIVAISSIRANGKLSLAVGDEILLFGSKLDSVRKFTDDHGVVVFDAIDTNAYCQVQYTIDTAAWVLSNESTRDYFSKFTKAIVFEKRERRMPLVARPYQVTVTQDVFMPLTGATKVIDYESNPMIFRANVDLPFPVVFGSRYASTLDVTLSGSLLFGGIATTSSVTPMSSMDEADFVVSVLDRSYIIDTSARAESGVWLRISGEYPHRIISVEWRKLIGASCSAFGECQFDGSYTFQAHVEERTGRVHMTYGVIDPIGDATANYIGVRGADYNDARTLSQIGDLDWYQPLVVDVVKRLNINKHNAPPIGLTYHWFNVATDVAADVEPAAVLISPQPSFDELLIKGLPKGSVLRLVDVMGRIVKSVEDIQPSIRIDLAALPSGRYSLLIDTQAGRSVFPVLIAR